MSFLVEMALEKVCSCCCASIDAVAIVAARGWISSRVKKRRKLGHWGSKVRVLAVVTL
jgi:hypothetical protein